MQAIHVRGDVSQTIAELDVLLALRVVPMPDVPVASSENGVPDVSLGYASVPPTLRL